MWKPLADQLAAEKRLSKGGPTKSLKSTATTPIELLPLLQAVPVPISEEYPATSGLSPTDYRSILKQIAVGSIAAGYFPSQSIDLEIADALPNSSENDGTSYKLYAGYRNIVGDSPVTRDSFVRIASMTKLVTALTVAKLHEKGYLHLDDPVGKYIPQYKKQRVIKILAPEQTLTFSTLDATSSSREVIVHLDAAVANAQELVGEYVGIQVLPGSGEVTGLPLKGIFRVVETLSSTALKVLLNDPVPDIAGGGLSYEASFKLDVLPSPFSDDSPASDSDSDSDSGSGSDSDDEEAVLYGAINVPTAPLELQSPLLAPRFYYTTVPTQSKVTIRQLLNHTSGHVYYDAINALAKQSIAKEYAVCAGIARELFGLKNTPVAPVDDLDVLQWAKLTAGVPLAFQPGTNWSYGLHLAVAGAVAVKAYRYRKRNAQPKPTLIDVQKELILNKLGIDAFYFVQDDDPERATKISNLVHVYTGADALLFGTPSMKSVLHSIYLNIIDQFGTNFTQADGLNPHQEGDLNPFHPIYGSQRARKLEYGDAGLCMKISDFKKLVEMVNNGGTHPAASSRVLDANLAAEFNRNQIGELNMDFQGPHGVIPGQKWSWGCQTGDESGKIADADQVSRNWGGVFSALYFGDVATNSRFVLASNSFGGALATLQAYVVRAAGYGFTVPAIALPGDELTAPRSETVSTHKAVPLPVKKSPFAAKPRSSVMARPWMTFRK